MHAQRSPSASMVYVLWTAKVGASAAPHKRRRPAARHKQFSNFKSRQGQRSEALVILKQKKSTAERTKRVVSSELGRF